MKQVTRKLLAPCLAFLLLTGMQSPVRPSKNSKIAADSERSKLPAPVRYRDTIQVPSSIDRTGSTNVSAEMGRFISGVKPRTVVMLPAHARFRIDNTVHFTGLRDVVIEGNGALFFAADSGTAKRRHLFVEDGSHVVLRNFSIKGANPKGGVDADAWKVSKAFQHGIQLVAMVGVEIDHVTITDTYGDFVYLGDNADKKWTDSVYIHDCTFARNGRQGIAITAARNVRIEHNSMTAVRQSSVDIEPNSDTGGGENIVIRENQFGPGRLKFFTMTGRGTNVSNILVEKNTLHGRRLTVVASSHGGATRRRDIRILDNTTDALYSSETAMMSFKGYDNVVIRGNIARLDSTRRMVAVKFLGVCGGVVEGNKFPGAFWVTQVLKPRECTVKDATRSRTGG